MVTGKDGFIAVICIDFELPMLRGIIKGLNDAASSQWSDKCVQSEEQVRVADRHIINDAVAVAEVEGAVFCTARTISSAHSVVPVLMTFLEHAGDLRHQELSFQWLSPAWCTEHRTNIVVRQIISVLCGRNTPNVTSAHVCEVFQKL